MVQANRSHWDAKSEEYQRAHGPQIGRNPKSWGAWSIPESDVRALGDLNGLRVLELGCGAGQWSGAIADEGLEVVGLDLSGEQLQAAREAMRTPFPIVQAAGEDVPFRDESFDVVFCDHGAMSWGDPFRTVPEASRVLRPGGRLVFTTVSPWLVVCYDDDKNRITTTLHHDYFGMTSEELPDGARWYQLPYGDWIRLFRANDFLVEDLIELRPPKGAQSTYFAVEPDDWPQRWPAETLWIVRRS